MIFSPLAGTPLISQGFGQNPDVYSVYGYSGHNGTDFACPVGTIIYAPHDGIAEVHDDGTEGYGKYLVINAEKRRSVLAHLSRVDVSNGVFVYQGGPIGLSGETGNCTGPHLHWTYKILSNGIVQNKNNGYDGAIDVTEFTRLWQDQDLHFDSQYTDDAQGYLAMNFAENQYLKNPARHA